MNFKKLKGLQTRDGLKICVWVHRFKGIVSGEMLSLFPSSPDPIRHAKKRVQMLTNVVKNVVKVCPSMY